MGGKLSVASGWETTAPASGADVTGIKTLPPLTDGLGRLQNVRSGDGKID
jgi:hypothetical protein